jgi:hypothetical protein
VFVTDTFIHTREAADVAQGADQICFGFFPQVPVVVQQHQGQISSDAGLLPLREFDAGWDYTRRMADCLNDPAAGPRAESQAGLEAGPEGGPGPRREHSLLSMLRQRFYGILAEYEDCNDHDTVRDDPILKLVCGRLPGDGALASQPTLSRFENLATPAVLQGLIDFSISTGVERLKQKHGGRLPAVVTLDLDPTDGSTYGDQQLTFYHAYYKQYQYYPLVISEPTTRHVFVAWLRFGTAHAALGADDDLMRVVNALRAERPDIVIHVRGDAGLGVPWMYEVCEGNRLFYTFGFTCNPRIKRMTDGLLAEAQGQFERTGQKARLFDCFQYRCEDWPSARTVVTKAECHGGGTNRRCVVTNLPSSCPLPDPAGGAAPPAPPAPPIATADEGEIVYDHYVQRGESEHRMDELKNGLHTDRLSCHRFMANFFRLQLHAAAYNLLNAVRDHDDIQPCTWRTHVIKVAAEVVQSTRRVVVRLAAQWPWWHLYQAVAERCASFSPGTIAAAVALKPSS